jgi:ribosome-binding factor A
MSERRVARVAERIRQEASQIILYELVDPRIRNVTVTRVDVSSDLRHAKVYVSVLGDEAKRRTVLRGLASARGLLRSRIGRSLGLRESPEIVFEFDPSIERSIELSRLIDQARAGSAAGASTPQPDAEPPDEPERADDEADEAPGDPGDDGLEPTDDDPGG